MTVADHFAGKGPNVQAIYDRLLAAARSFGRVEEDPKKTSIHLNRKTAFAGIATRREALLLTLKSATDINHPRIHKREQTSASRWHLEVRITDPDEVDAQLKEWLRAAYELSA